MPPLINMPATLVKKCLTISSIQHVWPVVMAMQENSCYVLLLVLITFQAMQSMKVKLVNAFKLLLA